MNSQNCLYTFPHLFVDYNKTNNIGDDKKLDQPGKDANLFTPGMRRGFQDCHEQDNMS